jgi:hypothetical protein
MLDNKKNVIINAFNTVSYISDFFQNNELKEIIYFLQDINYYKPINPNINYGKQFMHVQLYQILELQLYNNLRSENTNLYIHSWNSFTKSPKFDNIINYLISDHDLWFRNIYQYICNKSFIIISENNYQNFIIKRDNCIYENFIKYKNVHQCTLKNVLNNDYNNIIDCLIKNNFNKDNFDIYNYYLRK